MLISQRHSRCQLLRDRYSLLPLALQLARDNNGFILLNPNSLDLLENYTEQVGCLCRQFKFLNIALKCSLKHALLLDLLIEVAAFLANVCLGLLSFFVDVPATDWLQ